MLIDPQKPAAYLIEAEKCEVEAQRATRAEVRAAYGALAERWRALARPGGRPKGRGIASVSGPARRSLQATRRNIPYQLSFRGLEYKILRFVRCPTDRGKAGSYNLVLAAARMGCW